MRRAPVTQKNQALPGLILSALLLLLIIWARPGLPLLAGVDAACYARIAAEMAERAMPSWCEMRLWDAPFYEHPPGFLWILALAFRTFGESPETALMVGRLMATMAAAGAGAIAYRLGGWRATLGTWLVLPMLSEFLFESQNPMLEMPLAVGLLASTWGALNLRTRSGPILFVLGFVFAFWSKGPPAFAVLPVWAWAGFRGYATPRRLGWATLAAFVSCAISLAAFELWRARAGLPAFSSRYLAVQLWPSMTLGRHNPVVSPLFYGPVLWRWYPVGIVMALAAAALAGRRLLETRLLRLVELGEVSCLAFFFGFSVMRQKYEWYIHPMAPGFAWFGASVVATVLTREKAMRIVTGVLGAACTAYLVVLCVKPDVLVTRRPTFEAMYRVPPPTFEPHESRVVAYCDGPLGWRENHTMGFLWRARIVACDVDARWRFLNGELVESRAL